ncbi:MAG: hypothetical protein WC159_02895 [Sphaerochaetaceae bacterium]
MAKTSCGKGIPDHDQREVHGQRFYNRSSWTECVPARLKVCYTSFVP